MKNLIAIQTTVVLAGFALLLIKFTAYFITGSNAILSDALESIVNLVAGSVALYSIIISSRPVDKNHPYGHGKVEFLSATLEGSLIIVAGVYIIGKSIYNFIIPQDIENVDLGMYLTGGAGLVNFIMGAILVRQGRIHNSMTLEADGKHLISDGWTTVGLILGLTTLYFTGLNWIDNVIASVFGIVIIVTGIKILKKSIAGIMDEADMKLLGQIINVIESNRKPEWIDLHNLRVIKFGSRLHLDCHLTIPWYMDIRGGHKVVEEVEALVRKHFGQNAEMFIHTDPCKEKSCSICDISDCSKRLHPFEKKLVWDSERVLGLWQHELDADDKDQGRK